MVLVIVRAKFNERDNVKEVLRLCNDYDYDYHDIWTRSEICNLECVLCYFTKLWLNSVLVLDLKGIS